MLAELKLSNDSKTRVRKSQKNSLGLTPVKTCPGCTAGIGGCCEIKPGKKTRTCYVDKLLRIRPNVKKNLEHNTEVLRNTELTVDALRSSFAEFLSKEIKVGNTDIWFRLHWSGDLFSADYAKALATAMKSFPEINFWTYTRAFEYAEYLLDVPNLTLFLSLDMVNFSRGYWFYRQLKNSEHKCILSYCYMGTIPSGSELVSCPVDTGKLAIDGACHKCRLCFHGRNPVWFKTK